MRESPLTYLPLFQRVLQTEIGIRFKPLGIDRQQFVNTLHECRKMGRINNPEVDGVIIFSPAGGHEDEVWMCNKQVELDD